MIKKISFFLLLPIVLVAQSFTIPLWNSEIPNSTNSVLKESYSDEHYYVVTKPDIAVYLPSKFNRTKQAILIIPGGAYRAIAYTWEGTDVAKWLNAYGIVGIVLKYRLPNDTISNKVRYMSPILDATRAIKIIRANASKWNIDKNQIGVMGFSAGGHLAATLATHYNEKLNNYIDEIDTVSAKPNFSALIYPVITMDQEYSHMGSRENLIGENPTKEIINYFSNEKQVSILTPKTFLVHASNDKSVPPKNSIKFYEALLKNNVKCELHIYGFGGHGFSFANKQKYLSTWKDRFIDWLKEIK